MLSFFFFQFSYSKLTGKVEGQVGKERRKRNATLAGNRESYEPVVLKTGGATALFSVWPCEITQRCGAGKRLFSKHLLKRHLS